MSDELRCVSKGFEIRVKSYEKYDVNGYRFHTMKHQNERPNPKTINTGVFVGGADGTDYYGRLENIYKLSFLLGSKDLHLVVFKCHWFDPINGVRAQREIGLVEVKTSTVYPGSDVFVVADRKSTRLNSSHITRSRMPSSA